MQWRTLTYSLLSLSLAMPAAARAQDQRPAGPPAAETEQEDQRLTALEPLQVTGERLQRSLAETNSSVVVVTREDLAAGSAADLNDVVTQFANVIGAAGDREIAIRGVPQGGIGGEGDTISVYLDGVALSSRAASFAGPLTAWDLEQVEVFRGAQSTSRGRSSLAGSVSSDRANPRQTGMPACAPER